MKLLLGRGKQGQRVFIGNAQWENFRRVWNILARESRRNSSNLLEKEPSNNALKEIRNMISEIENFQTVSLMHVVALSMALDRKIKINVQEYNMKLEIGESRKAAIQLEYKYGHWSSPKGKISAGNKNRKNYCLFEAVGVQMQLSPDIIRQKTINEFNRKEKSLAQILDKIFFIPNWKEALASMAGGAKYDGRSPNDARRVIDNSHNGRCYPRGLKGHPRGHASYPGATGSDDSVENYSRGGWKTGFLSREDQNLVGNLAFVTDDAQRAMERLNRGSTDEAVHISVRNLGKDDLPMACEYRNGEQSGSPQRFQTVTVVMRHFMGEQENRNADVFIHTFYPRL